MKGVFCAEAIGLSASKQVTYRRLGLDRELYRHWRPWLAELIRPCPTFGYVREFVDAKVDYTRANSAGTRGVWFWWTLESGRFYETRYPVSWTRRAHRFLTVTSGGDVVDISEDEIRARWEEREVRRRWASVDSELMF